MKKINIQVLTSSVAITSLEIEKPIVYHDVTACIPTLYSLYKDGDITKSKLSEIIEQIKLSDMTNANRTQVTLNNTIEYASKRFPLVICSDDCSPESIYAGKPLAVVDFVVIKGSSKLQPTDAQFKGLGYVFAKKIPSRKAATHFAENLYRTGVVTESCYKKLINQINAATELHYDQHLN